MKCMVKPPFMQVLNFISWKCAVCSTLKGQILDGNESFTWVVTFGQLGEGSKLFWFSSYCWRSVWRSKVIQSPFLLYHINPIWFWLRNKHPILPYFTMESRVNPCEMCSDGLAPWLPAWLRNLQTLELECALVTPRWRRIKGKFWENIQGRWYILPVVTTKKCDFVDKKCGFNQQKLIGLVQTA